MLARSDGAVALRARCRVRIPGASRRRWSSRDDGALRARARAVLDRRRQPHGASREAGGTGDSRRIVPAAPRGPVVWAMATTSPSRRLPVALLSIVTVALIVSGIGPA